MTAAAASLGPPGRRGRLADEPGGSSKAIACDDDTRSVSHLAAQTAQRVRGLLVADLRDLQPWEHWRDEITEARSRLHTLAASAPAGAAVVIRPGSFRPWVDMWAGASIAHIGTITVESEDAEQIRRWTAALREKLG